MTEPQTPLWLRRTVLASLLGGLLLAGFVVEQGISIRFLKRIIARAQ